MLTFGLQENGFRIFKFLYHVNTYLSFYIMFLQKPWKHSDACKLHVPPLAAFGCSPVLLCIYRISTLKLPQLSPAQPLVNPAQPRGIKRPALARIRSSYIFHTQLYILHIMSLGPSSPRLPSPPPAAEIQMAPMSPSGGPAASLQTTPQEQTQLEASSRRRIHPGTKAADMAAGPPLIPLHEVLAPTVNIS